MKKVVVFIFSLGSIFLLTGCVDTKLSCTYESNDLDASTIYTFYFDDKEVTRPKKVSGINYYYNVNDIDLEKLEKEKCSSSNMCSVAETRDGYKVEWSYDIEDGDITEYGSYDETKLTLESGGWICE